jgi:adenylyltransferase/sulfurtransferase
VCGDHPTQTGLIDYELFCGVMPDGTPRPREGASPIPEMDATELAALLASDEPPFLLDVREPWEWAVSSLEDRGAVLVPMDELEARLDDVPRDRPVVVYCRSGQRSLDAAQRLVEDGAERVYNLRGGILAWARDVDPDMAVV